MEKRYVMALDQGTTSSRCILFDRQGKICSIAQREFPQYYPHSGWVEHDPMEIWATQISVATEAMSKIGADASDVAAIGITNQRETTVVWDKGTGEPVYRAIVWQCRRTADKVDELNRKGYGPLIRQKTGLIPDAYFSGTKIQWILEHVPGARQRAERGELLFGTVDTWLIWNLTKGKVHVTDYTNASRTMLYDIHKKQWDEELLQLLEIPISMMPQVKPSSCIYGYSSEKIMGGKIPIAGAAGDQQSALFGQCCFNSGDVKNTYGTGCFLLMNTADQAVSSQSGLLTTMAVQPDGSPGYALEGSVFVAGAAIQWLRDEIRIIESAAESERYCREVEDCGGVYVVPAFTGLGAPYWDQYARGAIIGITRGTSAAHLTRAALEGICYQVYDVLMAMENDIHARPKEIRVDGGAIANNFLMQFQADICRCPVVRPRVLETTALGAAYLAGLAIGYWKDVDELKEQWSLDNIFSAEMHEEMAEVLLAEWHKAVGRSLNWAAD